MRFWRCFWYLSAVSVIDFFVGRMLPKIWFRADRFPYRTYRLEQGGKIYERLNIRKWQNKVPDMSRILPFMMPPKRITTARSDKLPRMIQETCVAECIHGINCVAGLYCLTLYPGIGGVIVVLLYTFVFNVPYILIQRYNRPRLCSLYTRLKKREEQTRAAGGFNDCDKDDYELQHG